MVAGALVELVVLEQDPRISKPGTGDKEEVEDGAPVLLVVPGGLAVIIDEV